MTAIRAIEATAMLKQQPQAGLMELMSYLEFRGVRKGICTRNFEYVNASGRGYAWPEKVAKSGFHIVRR